MSGRCAFFSDFGSHSHMRKVSDFHRYVWMMCYRTQLKENMSHSLVRLHLKMHRNQHVVLLIRHSLKTVGRKTPTKTVMETQPTQPTQPSTLIWKYLQQNPHPALKSRSHNVSAWPTTSPGRSLNAARWVKNKLQLLAGRKSGEISCCLLRCLRPGGGKVIIIIFIYNYIYIYLYLKKYI